jgi:guanosine-3',5'-bis(diphosphate) 3'-pyrophosphohydrolase
MIRQFELVEKLKSYDPSADEDIVNRAYVFSMKVHGTQLRASGDPYFTHPLEVAGLLVEMHLDSYSIITALLHDTVEDTLTTIEEIQSLFGPEVAKLVDGVTKLSKLELQSEETKQAENFRKLLLAMSNDIRVLLVKLADRLHNMRTLHYVSEEKRLKIARETLEIYVPLAERIGINKIKDELEDLAFYNIFKNHYTEISNSLKRLEKNSEDAIRKIILELQQSLEDAGLKNFNISGRIKTPYSVWKKMEKKNITFEQLSDIMAFRIIVNDVRDCYHALGVIHSQYVVIPGRFKDYISTPKPNSYQSLHTDIIGPLKQRIELQIRTSSMHQTCELGVAAHWQYKSDNRWNIHDGKEYAWLRSLLEILDHSSSPKEFLEHTKLEMFQNEVFCFTPKGEVIALPKGACPLDFAYAIHSAVGDSAIGAKINGKQVPLRTILHNGDQVEILTSKTQTPSIAWERFVATGRAKLKIRQFIKSQKKQQFTALGKSLLLKGLQKENLTFEKNILEEICKVKNLDSVYSKIGEGQIGIREIIKNYKNQLKDEKNINHNQDDKILLEKSIVNKEIKEYQIEEDFVGIKGLIPGIAVHYSKCCHPLPGDIIQGVVVTGKGISIHTLECNVVKRILNKDKIIDLSWESNLVDKFFVTRIKVIFINKAGSLANTTTSISKSGGNILNIKVMNRTFDLWEVLFDVEIKDLEQLNNMIASLRSLKIISLVERI